MRRLLPLLALACAPEPDLPVASGVDAAAWCPADLAEVEARIDATLAEMSLKEKVEQLAGDTIYPVGGAWELDGVEALQIPTLRALDGPRGVSAMSGEAATAFPVAMARGATWDPRLEARVGAAIAQELRALGGNWLLAPTMNLLRHPRWGRAQETYGEDPVHVGAMATAFVQGVQGEGVLASAKHFAANSIENTRLTVDVSVSEAALHEVYLPHFEQVVQQGHVATVMTAYNQINGAYASESAPLLGLLKDAWGFPGLVESDWVWGTHDTVAAMQAGLDVEMPTASIYGDDLVDAVEDGTLDEALVDGALRRVLRTAWCHGLDAPAEAPDPATVTSEAHRALAREVARRGMVLLQNADALPLDPAATVVLTGRNAEVENLGDEGSSEVRAPDVVTAWEGFLARSEGTVLRLDDAADPQVAQADAVVVITGFDKDDEGEAQVSAGDRDSLALPAEEIDHILSLAAVHDRVIVVLEAGGAVTVEGWADAVEGIVHASYPGLEGGHALAEVLYGDHDPTGRLPFVVPRAEADLPPFDNTSARVVYGRHHGQRWLDLHGHEARFPLGFGLSYHRPTWSGLTVDTLQVAPDEPLAGHLTLHNPGPRPTTEIVQVYASRPSLADFPYARVLLGSVAVDLEAGETRDADWTVPLTALSVWDAGRGDRWIAPGPVQVHVGPDAVTDALAAEVWVAP